MNRHHPYGGYDEPPTRRRSASPPFRGGGRGRGRPGRGGGARGGYGAPAHMPPSGYDAYPTHAPQYSEPPYAPPPPGPDYSGYGAPDPAFDPYPQYSSGSRADPYEDYSYDDPGYGRSGPSDRGAPDYERGRGGGSNRGGRRRVRDDKVHDSIIEERINRERPCRTLFIRNIKYESNSDDIRRKFEEHGEIKTFFDLIKNRGMVFVTYFDLRAAEKAREQLQGMEIANRPIDVHYSLPREHEIAQRCDRDKNQGTTLVTLVNSASRQPIDENELRRKFLQFGDIKTIKPIFQNGIMRPDQRYVEVFDSRACVSAHDNLRDQPLQDGIMDLTFEWDVPDMPLPGGVAPIPRRSPVPTTRYDEPPHRGDSIERGIGPMRGGPPPPWERRGPPPPHARDDYRDRRDYPPPPPPPMSPRDYRDDRDRRPSYPSAPPPPQERGAPAPYGDRDYGREGYAPRGERYPPRGGHPGGRGGRDDFGPDRASRMGAPAPGTDEFGRSIPSGRTEDRGGSFDTGRHDGYAPRPSDIAGYNFIPPPSGGATTTDDRLEQAKKVQQLLAALKPGSSASAPALPPVQQPPQLPPQQPFYGGHPPFPPTGGGPPPFSFNQHKSSLPAAPYGSTAPSAGGSGPLGGAAPSAAGVQSLLALLAQNQNR